MSYEEFAREMRENVPTVEEVARMIYMLENRTSMRFTRFRSAPNGEDIAELLPTDSAKLLNYLDDFTEIEAAVLEENED